MASRTTTIRHTTRTPPRPNYRPEEQAPSEPEQSLPPEVDPEPEYEAEGESPRPEENQAIPVKTVGQEQLERSREMQAMGINNWVAAHDERDPNAQPEAVAGVGPYEQ